MAIYANITPAPESKPLTIGPRTRREIALRIRELAARLNPTIFDLADLARLRELLKSTGGSDAS
jgi:hypothetical protein